MDKGRRAQIKHETCIPEQSFCLRVGIGSCQVDGGTDVQHLVRQQTRMKVASEMTRETFWKVDLGWNPPAVMRDSLFKSGLVTLKLLAPSS